MPSLCLFELFKQPEVYLVGEPIEGTITLITTNDKHIGGMAALLKGKGKVRYQENYQANKPYQLELPIYKGSESYLVKIIGLEAARVLPAGSYTYNIKFTLDEYCLTSCESERGHIRYELSLAISRLKGYDNVFKHGVTVINNVDLIIDPSFDLSLQSQIKYCECCCMGETIFCTLRMSSGVFTPGQVLKYTLEFHETSRKVVKCFTVRLVKKMSFISKSPICKMCTTKNYIVSRILPIEKLAHHIMEDEFLIPATPPTTLGSNIIYIEYELKAAVEIFCCFRSNLSAKIPVIIVAVPLKVGVLPNQVSKRYTQECLSQLLDQQSAYTRGYSSVNDFKRLHCSEADNVATAVNMPFYHYPEEPLISIRRAKMQAAEAFTRNLPFLIYDEQPSTYVRAAKMVKESAGANVPFVGYEEQPSKSIGVAKHEGAARVDLPLMAYEQQPLTSIQAAKMENEAAAAKFPFMSYEEQTSLLPTEDAVLNIFSTDSGKQPSSTTNKLPFMGYENQPNTSMTQSEAAALNSFFMGYVKEPPAKKEESVFDLPFMGFERKSLTSTGAAHNWPFKASEEQLSTSCGAIKKTAALNLPTSSYEEQPSSSRPAKMSEAAAAVNLPCGSYEEQFSSLCIAKKDNKTASLNIAFMGYEEQPSTSCAVIKDKSAPYKSYVEHPPSTTSSGVERYEEGANALNLPFMGYVEQPSTSQDHGSALNLPFTGMGYEEQPTTSLEAKKLEADAALNFPFRCYEEQQAMFLEPKNDNPNSADTLPFIDYENQSSVFNALLRGYEEQQSMSRGVVGKNNVPAATNLPLKSCENQTSKSRSDAIPKKRSSGSNRENDAASVSYPIEIDALRDSKTVILPPNGDDSRPTSFEFESYPEPSFIDVDLAEYDRLSDFRPRYPMYCEKSYCSQNDEIEEQNSVNGLRRLRAKFAEPPTDRALCAGNLEIFI